MGLRRCAQPLVQPGHMRALSHGDVGVDPVNGVGPGEKRHGAFAKLLHGGCASGPWARAAEANISKPAIAHRCSDNTTYKYKFACE